MRLNGTAGALEGLSNVGIAISVARGERRKMKRTLAVSAALVGAFTAATAPAQGQRRASVGLAAGATFPVGDLGDATSTGFHVLGTLSISGTATTPLGFRVDGMYNSLSGKSS